MPRLLPRPFHVAASVLILAGLAAGCAPSSDEPEVEDAPQEPRPSGLLTSAEGVAPGYVLYSPLSSGTTYLLDTDGRPVHTWESDYAPHSLYLLPNGNLLRPGRDPDGRKFTAGGMMGLLQLFDWEGELLWQWKLSGESQILHHDVEPLPNGNLLAIAWELKTEEEGRAAGRRPDLIPEDGLWSEVIMEIEPLPPDDARIVWSWHVWDHLIQNFDAEAENYGDPAEHPERIDINGDGPPLEIDAEQLEELKALGYIPDVEENEGDEDADGDEDEDEPRPDFLHINAVDWHPELDQIAMTPPTSGEVWIIARPSSTEEAARPGGDLLYRWGNPATYGRGTPAGKKLFSPHDVQWILPDQPRSWTHHGLQQRQGPARGGVDLHRGDRASARAGRELPTRSRRAVGSDRAGVELPRLRARVFLRRLHLGGAPLAQRQHLRHFGTAGAFLRNHAGG